MKVMQNTRFTLPKVMALDGRDVLTDAPRYPLNRSCRGDHGAADTSPGTGGGEYPYFRVCAAD